jgi:hypothetical protein
VTGSATTRWSAVVRYRWLVIALLVGTVACGVPPDVAEDGGAAGGGACERTEATADVDWVDFLQLGGRTYHRTESTDPAQQLGDEQVGEVVAVTRCRIAGAVHDPSYVLRDGDAAYLRPGTRIHAVVGFDTGARVAADVAGTMEVYDVQQAPGAEHGEDLYGDLASNVTAIAVNSDEDGVTTVGRITDEGEVRELTTMVQRAPIAEVAAPGGTGLHLAFEFEHAPPLVLVLAVDGEVAYLANQLAVPDAFVDAIRDAAGGR